MKPLLLAPIAALLAATGAQAAFNPAIVSADARWVGYVDFGALRTSAVGQQLMDAAVKAEAAKGLPVQIDLPKVLATIGSVTAYGSNFAKDPKLVDGTTVIQGTPALPKIAEALLIQATLSHPEMVTEVKGLGYPAYAVGNAKSGSPLVVAFPPEGEVLASRSEERLRRARAVLIGGGGSLAQSAASPLQSLLPNAEGATLFAASVVPGDEILQANAPQTRILRMTSSAAVALGEEGDKTFAHVVLTASNDDTADKLDKILQGMTAMMSLAQSSDQQITDFLNSAKVDRQGDIVTLRLAYSSEKLAELIKTMAAARAPRIAAGPVARNPAAALERAFGEKVFSWDSANAAVGAGNPAAAPAAEWQQDPNPVQLDNGAEVSVRILGHESAARFEELELTPAGGGSPLVFTRRLVGEGRRSSVARVHQFGFPGEDGKYTLRVRVQPAANAKTSFEIWVKNPTDRAAVPVQQP